MIESVKVRLWPNSGVPFTNLLDRRPLEDGCPVELGEWARSTEAVWKERFGSIADDHQCAQIYQRSIEPFWTIFAFDMRSVLYVFFQSSKIKCQIRIRCNLWINRTCKSSCRAGPGFLRAGRFDVDVPVLTLRPATCATIFLALVGSPVWRQV